MIPDLRVLYRAIPEDKTALVIGLRTVSMAGSGTKAVAVTGEGLNDRAALEEADVGISMGNAGCDVAKNASDIILLDDNFSNVIRSVMWGRNIYNNIRKFLLFQVTVGVACLLVVFLSGTIYGQSPLTIVQLLWINLIMDALAALALATEPPRTIALQAKPVKSSDPIMTSHMWRQIMGVAVWQVVIVLFLQFAGPALWDLDFPYSATPVENANRKVLNTIIFNTFVFMQIFNELNARKIGEKEFNPFVRLFNNWLFLFIVAGQVGMQFVFIEIIPVFAQCASLDSAQWMMCVLLGSTVLIVAPVLKVTPDRFKEMIPKLVDEENQSEDDKVTALFNKAAKGQSAPKTAPEAEEEQGPTSQ